MSDPKPSSDSQSARTIRVEMMTRVEGEGGLDIRLRDGQLEAVRFHIFEPPRLFEALLRGRALEDVPDITARICGICPVAYQMSSTHALEAALGMTLSPEIRRLRRLLYCAEWIESHALHVHMLHLPDFLGYAGALEMAKDHREEVARGLQLRKHGNTLLERIGGRAIHPINVTVGGFFRAPRRDELSGLIPDFEQPYDFVSLVHPDEYPMCGGRIETSDGLSITSDQFEQTFSERQVPHSTAMQAVRTDTGGTYLLGPLARINHNRDRLMPTALRLADEIAFETPCRNPFKAILARSLELVHAYEEALEILKTYRPPKPPRVSYEYRRGAGSWATEAPRGLLYHRYGVDEAGRVEHANIIPPTSQNQSQIEADLRSYVPGIVALPDDELAASCERLVRCYDPCISCSTHFLKVRVERR